MAEELREEGTAPVDAEGTRRRLDSQQIQLIKQLLEGDRARYFDPAQKPTAVHR